MDGGHLQILLHPRLAFLNESYGYLHRDICNVQSRVLSGVPNSMSIQTASQPQLSLHAHR